MDFSAKRSCLRIGPWAMVLVVAQGCSPRLSTEQSSLELLQSLDAGVEFNEQGEIHFVNLSRIAVTDDQLTCLLNHPGLRELWLHDTVITDAGLVHVSRLRELEILVLSKTGITDDGLIKLARLTNLKELYIGETDISLSGIERLQQLMPNTKIVL